MIENYIKLKQILKQLVATESNGDRKTVGLKPQVSALVDDRKSLRIAQCAQYIHTQTHKLCYTRCANPFDTQYMYDDTQGSCIASFFQ